MLRLWGSSTWIASPAGLQRTQSPNAGVFRICTGAGRREGGGHARMGRGDSAAPGGWRGAAHLKRLAQEGGDAVVLAPAEAAGGGAAARGGEAALVPHVVVVVVHRGV